MIVEKILSVLKSGPKTVKGISFETGIPIATLRSALMDEFYIEKEVTHKDGYTVQAWTQNPTCKIKISGTGMYYLLDNPKTGNV